MGVGTESPAGVLNALTGKRCILVVGEPTPYQRGWKDGQNGNEYQGVKINNRLEFIAYNQGYTLGKIDKETKEKDNAQAATS